MLNYLLLFINPIVTLASFWLFFYYGQGVYIYIGLAIVNIILTGRLLARFYFWRFRLLWLNLIFVYISQFLFLVLLSSDTSRYNLALLLSLFWALIWWLLSRYFTSLKDPGSRQYLGINRFWYFLAFWFLSTSLYSLVIFLNFSLWQAWLAIIIVTLTWSREMLSPNPNLTYWELALVVFINAQISAALYFLPVNFYVAGTIATLWFFFIIDNIIVDNRRFGWYLLAFVSSLALILISSIL